MYDYDVISIGAGSGGCSSAMRSADLGKKVAIVEARDKDGIGGTCVNRGCIPTKVLVKSAEVFDEVREAKKYGIVVGGCSVDFKQVQAKKKAAIQNLKFALEKFLIKPRKIDIKKGHAKLLDEHTVEVSGAKGVEIITAENIILAMGSEPALIPTFNIDGKNIITSDHLMDIEEIPEEMMIVGAGALGLEFAYIFSTFGCRVTVVEMMDHVVPVLRDKEVTDAVEAYLKKCGVTVKTSVKLNSIKVQEDGKVAASFADGEVIETSKVLVAIGRKLNTSNAGLQELGIKMDEKGRVVIDAKMRTSIPNIFAVGDIVQGPQLSHKAQRQGLVAAETIAGLDVQMNEEVIPWAIFMQPEIAGVGLTCAEAEERGIKTIVGKLPFNANEKAMAMQKTTGIMKIVAREDNGKIIGGQIFGADASVLIAEIGLAIENEITMDKIAACTHAHPTLSELVMETCKNGLGKAFHK